MRNHIYAGLTVLAAILGLTSAWLPSPFESVSIYLIAIGFVIVILMGHRMAFRADDAGVFAFWWKPMKMTKAEVDDSDQWPMFLGLVAVFAPILSMLSRMIWLA